MEKKCCFCEKKIGEKEKTHKSIEDETDSQCIFWCDTCDKNEDYLNI